MPLGTEWVAPGEGATVKELALAFGIAPPITMEAGRRTRLALTGKPIQGYDYERLTQALLPGTAYSI